MESIPPITPNERKTAAILRDLHRKHGENLKSGGHDPNKARVASQDIVEALRAQRIPTETLQGLLQRGLVVCENGYWWPLKRKKEEIR